MMMVVRIQVVLVVCKRAFYSVIETIVSESGNNTAETGNVFTLISLVTLHHSYNINNSCLHVSNPGQIDFSQHELIHVSFTTHGIHGERSPKKTSIIYFNFIFNFHCKPNGEFQLEGPLAIQLYCSVALVNAATSIHRSFSFLSR